MRRRDYTRRVRASSTSFTSFRCTQVHKAREWLDAGVLARSRTEVRGDFIAFRFYAFTSISCRCNSGFYCSRMADGLAPLSHRRQLCMSLRSLPQRTRIHPLLRYYLHTLLSHALSISSLGFRQCRISGRAVRSLHSLFSRLKDRR